MRVMVIFVQYCVLFPFVICCRDFRYLFRRSAITWESWDHQYTDFLFVAPKYFFAVEDLCPYELLNTLYISYNLGFRVDLVYVEPFPVPCRMVYTLKCLLNNPIQFRRPFPF